ncbi:hypothetical protein F5148DRAFT_191660 [Russula earlei]|uniref:Uncharacterized protein n=1 Tax=Russula earlei TaxID=71964 RepID=A0ACC0TSD6_9AGAM|nr:hypothetical protein F5148DRAFT_191660 [Russula earlei]
MVRAAWRHQTLPELPTSPTTDSDNAIRPPHQGNVQVSTLTDVLSRLECELNQFQSAIQTPKALSAALSTLDNEIDAARRLTHTLLTRRNTLAPISVLPSELLARIFHFHSLGMAPWPSPVSLGWITVTHVCKHWRQVALDDSTLWARISDFPPSNEWISEMLARARSAPLVIDVDGLPSHEALSLFLPHLSHTRSLRIDGICLSHCNRFYEFFLQEAPALEHFELGLSSVSPVTFPELGTTFFKNQVPKLKTLCLSEVRMPWSLIPRAQLTQLKVILSKEMPTAGVTRADEFNQFIGLLINCPTLEVLALECCLPTILSQHAGGQTIRFPHLSRLFLGGSSSRVTNLLKTFSLPASTKLRLRCFPERDSSYNDHVLLPLVSAHFHNPAPVKFRSFKVTLNHVDCLIHVVASTSYPTLTVSPSHVFLGDTESDAELVLSFDELSASSQWANILQRVCSTLPISDVEHLSISSHDSIQPLTWGELFRRCTKVTMIKASGRGTTSLLGALTPPKRTNATPALQGKKKRRGNPAQASNDAPAHVPIFPKLTTLVLEMLDFSDRVAPSGILYDVLTNAFKWRKSNKPRLRTLGINSCVISMKRAKALEKLVQDFRWDRYEGVSLDEGDWGYRSDFVEDGARWQDFFIGTTQTEWDWWENHSDGW